MSTDPRVYLTVAAFFFLCALGRTETTDTTNIQLRLPHEVSEWTAFYAVAGASNGSLTIKRSGILVVPTKDYDRIVISLLSAHGIQSSFGTETKEFKAIIQNGENFEATPNLPEGSIYLLNDEQNGFSKTIELTSSSREEWIEEITKILKGV